MAVPAPTYGGPNGAPVPNAAALAGSSDPPFPTGGSTVFTNPAFNPGPQFLAAYPNVVNNPYAGSYPGGGGGSVPPPTPDPALIAPNVDYVGAFQASMGRQRQALDNALTTSLQQLGGRRDAAAKVIAGIPGAVSQTFQQAEGQQANVQGHADKAVGTGKAGGAKGGDLNAGLYQNELTANEGAGKAVTPLLQLGATANYDLGAAGLQQQHLAGVSALDAQQSAFNQQMAQQQAAEQWQAQQANWQQSIAPKTSFGQEEILKGIDPATGVPFDVESGGKATNPKTGLTADQTARLQATYDDQAKKAGYTSAAGQQAAAVQGPQLAKVIAEGMQGPNADAAETLKIVSGHIEGSEDLRNWFKKNQPGLYAQFQAMGGKAGPPGSKGSGNPAFP